jgi:uncharacterized membrane protein
MYSFRYKLFVASCLRLRTISHSVAKPRFFVVLVISAYTFVVLLGLAQQSAHAQATVSSAIRSPYERITRKETPNGPSPLPVTSNYNITVIPSRPYRLIIPTGINSKGVIVGYILEVRHTYGVRYSHGNWGVIGNHVPIGGANAVDIEISGINAAGIMVGTSMGHDGVYGGVVLRGSVCQVLKKPFAAFAKELWYARGINDKDQIVGICENSKYVNVGFLRTDGEDIIINPARSGSGMFSGVHAIALNNKGVVVGTFYDSKYNEHGFVYQSRHLNIYDRPGFRDTSFTGINDNGIIVGSSRQSMITPDINHPFLWMKGKFVPVPGLADYNSIALSGLNNNGQLIGQCWNVPKLGTTITSGPNPIVMSPKMVEKH